MIDKLYDRFKKDFSKFLVGMEKTFDEVWQEFLQEMTLKKAEIESKIEGLEKNKSTLEDEEKTLISDISKLSNNKLKLSAAIDELEKRNKSVSEELLKNTEKIEELKNKDSILKSKEEELGLKEITQKAKDDSIREREARINSIFNKINS
uniref:Uncharacterized protein n=1 Tax=viral metagenome TaxID=1070528 RepID=A0A6M3IQ25_9ZZZZ